MHVLYLDKSLGYTNVYYTFVKTHWMVHLSCMFQCKEIYIKKEL